MTYLAGGLIWLLTTTLLLYFLKIFLLAEPGPARIAWSVFSVGVLALHTGMSVFLSDGWRIRARKLDRENSFISFLGRFE